MIDHQYAVLAHSRNSYHMVFRKLPGFKYIGKVDDLIGARFTGIIRLGGWYENKAYDDERLECLVERCLPAEPFHRQFESIPIVHDPSLATDELRIGPFPVGPGEDGDA